MGWFGMRGRRAPALATLALLGLAATHASAQSVSIPRSIVDAPTSGIMPPGSFETRTLVYPGGGMEVRLDIGIAPWLSLGGGYGGMQIIGDGDPDWNPRPGFFVKARVVPETFSMPALAIGIDTQGSGFYDPIRERYQFKSRGLYAVASKNYAWLGDLSLHGGLSRSLEEHDDGDLTPFVGADKTVGAVWGVAVEYDLAVNDNLKDGAFGRGRGYLNGAVRWNLAPQMQVRFVLRDMLKNSETVDPLFSDVIVDEGWGREFSFSYVESF